MKHWSLSCPHCTTAGTWDKPQQQTHAYRQAKVVQSAQWKHHSNTRRVGSVCFRHILRVLAPFASDWHVHSRVLVLLLQMYTQSVGSVCFRRTFKSVGSACSDVHSKVLVLFAQKYTRVVVLLLQMYLFLKDPSHCLDWTHVCSHCAMGDTEHWILPDCVKHQWYTCTLYTVHVTLCSPCTLVGVTAHSNRTCAHSNRTCAHSNRTCAHSISQTTLPIFLTLYTTCTVASFPGHFHFQHFIACSMQIWRRKRFGHLRLCQVHVDRQGLVLDEKSQSPFLSRYSSISTVCCLWCQGRSDTKPELLLLGTAWEWGYMYCTSHNHTYI